MRLSSSIRTCSYMWDNTVFNNNIDIQLYLQITKTSQEPPMNPPPKNPRASGPQDIPKTHQGLPLGPTHHNEWNSCTYITAPPEGDVVVTLSSHLHIVWCWTLSQGDYVAVTFSFHLHVVNLWSSNNAADTSKQQELSLTGTVYLWVVL